LCRSAQGAAFDLVKVQELRRLHPRPAADLLPVRAVRDGNPINVCFGSKAAIASVSEVENIAKRGRQLP
jgi:hypothetical protein